eukprot:199897_1
MSVLTAEEGKSIKRKRRRSTNNQTEDVSESESESDKEQMSDNDPESQDYLIIDDYANESDVQSSSDADIEESQFVVVDEVDESQDVGDIVSDSHPDTDTQIHTQDNSHSDSEMKTADNSHKVKGPLKAPVLILSHPLLHSADGVPDTKTFDGHKYEIQMSFGSKRQTLSFRIQKIIEDKTVDKPYRVLYTYKWSSIACYKPNTIPSGNNVVMQFDSPPMTFKKWNYADDDVNKYETLKHSNCEYDFNWTKYTQLEVQQCPALITNLEYMGISKVDNISTVSEFRDNIVNEYGLLKVPPKKVFVRCIDDEKEYKKLIDTIKNVQLKCSYCSVIIHNDDELREHIWHNDAEHDEEKCGQPVHDWVTDSSLNKKKKQRNSKLLNTKH